MHSVFEPPINRSCAIWLAPFWSFLAFGALSRYVSIVDTASILDFSRWIDWIHFQVCCAIVQNSKWNAQSQSASANLYKPACFLLGCMAHSPRFGSLLAGMEKCSRSLVSYYSNSLSFWFSHLWWLGCSIQIYNQNHAVILSLSIDWLLTFAATVVFKVC